MTTCPVIVNDWSGTFGMGGMFTCPLILKRRSGGFGMCGGKYFPSIFSRIVLETPACCSDRVDAGP